MAFRGINGARGGYVNAALRSLIRWINAGENGWSLGRALPGVAAEQQGQIEMLQLNLQLRNEFWHMLHHHDYRNSASLLLAMNC